MQLTRYGFFLPFLVLAPALHAASGPRVHRGPTAPRALRTRTAPPKPNASISPERVTQIQTALISAGYLSGSPTGTWDETTKTAMQKLQAENGWQTKLVPDSRAIIKLGLGPNSTATLAPTAESISGPETIPTPAPEINQ